MIISNRLFVKLSLVFLCILIITAVVLTFLNQYTAQNYYEEANQRLNANLAQYTADHIPNTFDENLKIDTLAIQEIMHSMMVINPNVEVYLLNSNGTILSHVAPYKKVVRESVNLEPIKSFLDAEGKVFIKGDDPRDFNCQKVFSAAPVYKNNEILGYYYIILASEEQVSLLSSIRNAYTLRLGIRLLFFTLLGSLLLGLVAIWYQTKNLSTINKVIHQFLDGDYSARIQDAEKGDFSFLAKSFNKMANQIQQYIEKIVSINTFRKELIANISHDLRTPLSIIQGYSETLQMKRQSLSSKKIHDYLDNIHESTKRLNGLVNQLFELSKLESNQIQVHKEPFPIDELARDLMQRFDILAQEKNIQLSFEKVDKLPIVFADVALVERVVQNLLDNAIKFTPPGGEIKIAIHKNQENVEVQIIDTGSGISDDQKTAIFQRYVKSEPSEKSTSGSGLGLAIANRIMELHNSSIQVSSQLHKGSTFTFQLPVFST